MNCYLFVVVEIFLCQLVTGYIRAIKLKIFPQKILQVFSVNIEDAYFMTRMRLIAESSDEERGNAIP
jgi:hypothetical protein